MTPLTHIALVDDDRNILLSVSIALEAEGYHVDTYHDGEAGLTGILETKPDLAILDIKMPRMDGMELLSKIRETSTLPVIFLTSKDDEMDEASGLAKGADDYITKPFSQKLLIARIKALLRRQEYLKSTEGSKSSKDATGSDHTKNPDASQAPPKAQTSNIMTRGALVLDDDRHECKWQGHMVHLTVTEYLLIRALADHPGHVQSRDQLIDAAYGETIYIDDRTVDSHIKRLRKKFKDVDGEFNKIETLYGLGYRFKDE